MRIASSVLLLLAGLAATLLAAEQKHETPGSRGDAGELKPPPPAPVADNSRCLVCHANYEDEQLSVVHAAKGNIGCVRCHGESSPHSTDENGLTAPDRMYPKSHVRLNCLGCHDWVKLIESDKTKVDRTDLQEKPNHQAVLDGTAREKRFCTDCHGEHKMYYRTRVWDKRSGVLISRDATPDMVPVAPK